MRHLLAMLDSRIRLPDVPEDVAAALVARFEHPNPDYAKAAALGYSTRKLSPVLRTWRVEDGVLTLPRGGTERLREISSGLGWAVSFSDRRLSSPTGEWPRPLVEPWPHQVVGVAECIRRQQCLVRAGTGSGKTTMALLSAAALAQRALVIMRDGNLLDQWLDEATLKLGLPRGSVGVLRGGKLRVGERLTLALQQTLYSERFPLLEAAQLFGAVLVDEVQGVGARTFEEVMDVFPAKYRLGFSANETRKDGKECLVYDQFGDSVHEVPQSELLEAGVVLPVTVRLVPTEFRADWYRDAEPRKKDFGRLVEQMIADEGRNRLLVELVRGIVHEGEVPAFVFTARREYSRLLADDVLYHAGIRSGLMLGGDEDRQRFGEDKQRLREGDAEVGVGTYEAIGTGLDVAAVRAGVMATPLGKNPQRFGQVRGRICRAAPGKRTARIYVLWDRHVFPRALHLYKQWNGGDVELPRGDGTWYVP